MKVNFKRNIILRGSWINVNILIKLLDCSPFCSRFTDTEEKADICYNCICDICDKSVLLWNTYVWRWHCVWSNPAGSYFSQTRCTVLWQVCNMSPPLSYLQCCYPHVAPCMHHLSHLTCPAAWQAPPTNSIILGDPYQRAWGSYWGCIEGCQVRRAIKKGRGWVESIPGFKWISKSGF